MFIVSLSYFKSHTRCSDPEVTVTAQKFEGLCLIMAVILHSCQSFTLSNVCNYCLAFSNVCNYTKRLAFFVFFPNVLVTWTRVKENWISPSFPLLLLRVWFPAQTTSCFHCSWSFTVYPSYWQRLGVNQCNVCAGIWSIYCTLFCFLSIRTTQMSVSLWTKLINILIPLKSGWS